MHSQLVIQRLRALELERVAVTAAIDPTGRLRAVADLWPKLLGAARDAAAMGLVRAAVVADEQADAPEELCQEGASPLRIIRAGTIQEAVERLYQEHGPSYAVREHERRQCATLDILGRSVPIEVHYQALPLLYEVKRERLPPEARSQEDAHLEETEEDSPPDLRPFDILRWEEAALREAHVAYERCSLEEALSDLGQVARDTREDVPRFVVLGPPGSGKTTLAQYLGWRVGKGDLLVSGRQLVPVRARLREWEAWAATAGNAGAGLPEYLTHRYKDIAGAPTLQRWRQWLHQGEVLLLLDGLDELGGSQPFVSTLKETLVTFKVCPTVLTCRTVSFERHTFLCPDLPVFTLAGLDDAQRNAYIRAFPAEHVERYDPEALIGQLERTPQMRPVAANPLLLSIICHVVDDPKGVSLPATRGELYDKAVEKLLSRRRRVEVSYPGGKGDLPPVRQRRILEQAALKLFAGGAQHRQLAFDEGTLLDALTGASQQEGYLADAAAMADALLEDITANSGLLRGDAEQGYFFLHLTFHEFLAVCALASRLSVSVQREQEIWWSFLKGKFADERWQSPVTLLAGRLKDPTPLVQRCAKINAPLAALCLLETDRVEISVQEYAVEELLRALPHDRRLRLDEDILWECWRRATSDEETGARGLRSYIITGLLAWHGYPFARWLFEDAIKSPDRQVRLLALEGLAHIGSSDVAELLSHHALDNDPSVRDVVFAALKRIPDGEAFMRRRYCEANGDDRRLELASYIGDLSSPYRHSLFCQRAFLIAPRGGKIAVKIPVDDDKVESFPVFDTSSQEVHILSKSSMGRHIILGLRHADGLRLIIEGDDLRSDVKLPISDVGAVALCDVTRRLYVGTGDKAPALYCCGLTGTVEWEATFESAGVSAIGIGREGDVYAGNGLFDFEQASITFLYETAKPSRGYRLSSFTSEGRMRWDRRLEEGIEQVSLSPEGGWLAARTTGGDIVFVDPRSGDVKRHLRGASARSIIAAKSADRIVVLGLDSGVSCYTVQKPHRLWHFDPGGPGECLDLDENGDVVILCGSPLRILRLNDAGSVKAVKPLTPETSDLLNR